MQNIDAFATGPMWAGFIAFVLAMLALDLFVLGGNKAHRVSVKEAGAWVAAWVTLALRAAADPSISDNASFMAWPSNRRMRWSIGAAGHAGPHSLRARRCRSQTGHG